jgi:hypothetical protein
VSLLAAYLSTLGGAGGGGGTVVTLADQSIFDGNSGGASAGYNLLSTGGILSETSFLGPLPIGEWISPTSAAPGAYEVRADVVVGSVSGTTGSWLALTSNRQWSVGLGAPGYASAIIDVSIRLGGTTLTTARIQLTAEAF